MNHEVIVTCAVTGAGDTVGRHPAIPVTPKQIAAAAIEAATAGRRVVLLEKAPKLGGTTAWSIGSISATATPHQQAKGIKDPARIEAFMRAVRQA